MSQYFVLCVLASWLCEHREVISPHSVQFCLLRSGHNDAYIAVLLGQLNEVVCTFLSLSLLPDSCQFYIPCVPKTESLLHIILPIVVSHGNHSRSSDRCPCFRQKKDFQNSYWCSSTWTPLLIPVCYRAISKLWSRTLKTLWLGLEHCPTPPPPSPHFPHTGANLVMWSEGGMAFESKTKAICQTAELTIQEIHVTVATWTVAKGEVFVWNLCLGHISLSLEGH